MKYAFPGPQRLPTSLFLYYTRTTTRSCRDPETAITNFWSGGVHGRPQRVPLAASVAAAAAGAAAVAPGAVVYPNG